MPKDTCWVDVDLMWLSPTGLAWKLQADNGIEAWVPVAAIMDSEDDLGPGISTRIEIPTAMAEEKELV